MPSVESHGASIYYEKAGSGPAIVFAHGAGGNAMIWWQQVPHFARRFRVVTFDHRGFARSPCPIDDWQPSWFADDLLAILDALSIERAALVCQSMGGWTGVQTVLRAPERVSCLVLCGTPGGVVTPAVTRARSEIQNRVRGGTRGIGAVATAPALRERAPATAFLYDQISSLNPGVPPEALSRLMDLQVPEDALSRFRVPTLVIAGELDVLFPPAALHEVGERIPGAQVHDFPGVGHSSYFEDPDTFNPLVEDFVSKHLPV